VERNEVYAQSIKCRRKNEQRKRMWEEKEKSIEVERGRSRTKYRSRRRLRIHGVVTDHIRDRASN
jgi:hypothetical protein